jgi:hypothetical protein
MLPEPCERRTPRLVEAPHWGRRIDGVSRLPQTFVAMPPVTSPQYPNDMIEATAIIQRLPISDGTQILPLRLSAHNDARRPLQKFFKDIE